jgi:hypothetical protein
MRILFHISLLNHGLSLFRIVIIFVGIHCSKNISRSFKREIWQYKKINYEKFEEKLIEINWNEKLDHLNDVDEICEQFTKCFLKIAQECIPTNIITIRNNDRPWFNNEI